MENMFSERIRTLRINRKIQQKELASFLDISIRQYQRYEKGDQEPNIAGLIRLSMFFDVSIDYLVGRTDNPSSHNA